MLSSLFEKLNLDWWAILVVALLIVSGLSAIFSLSFDDAGGAMNNFQKQLIFLGIGFFVFISFSFLDYRTLRNYSFWLYVFGILLLVAVLFFGKTIRGTSGWFSLYFFNIQPVELMKLFLIVVLADFFSKRAAGGIGWGVILSSLPYISLPVFLAILQPDMGSAAVMISIWLGMLFVAGTKVRYFLIFLVAGVVFAFSGWQYFLKDYQKQRVLSFVDPMKDPLGSGYNVIQSVVSIGSGGLTGKGLGHGSQSQLNFLPENHTDFIFAAIAEESGLIGTGIILFLFLFLAWRFYQTMTFSRDFFGRLLVGGIMSMTFFQVFVNIGMNLGVVPVAGLSLPFLSYGGSFLVICLLAFGITQSVWRKRVKTRLMINELG